MVDDSTGLLNVAQTAKLLQRSTEQVRRYLREGALPGQRLGGQWFIRREHAELLLQARSDRAETEQHAATNDPDPLAGAIAVGGSGGADIAIGRLAYLRSLTERP